MFAEDVSSIVLRIYMYEAQDACCDGFTTAVERQSVPAFGELGMRKRRGVDHGLIVFKHHVWSSNGDPEIPKCVSEIDDLLGTCLGSSASAAAVVRHASPANHHARFVLQSGAAFVDLHRHAVRQLVKQSQQTGFVIPEPWALGFGADVVDSGFGLGETTMGMMD